MKKRFTQVLRLLAYILVLITAGYIMFHKIGLIDGLDFGAGAYYYADIPNFSKYVNATHYDSSVSMPLLILLFFLWGGIMYALWTLLEKTSRKHKKE